MEFSFNFNVEKQSCSHDDAEDERKDGEKKQSRIAEVNASVHEKEAREHVCKPFYLSLSEPPVTETVTIGTFPPFIYLNESVIERTAPERDDEEKILSQTTSQNSDLITGVYEGGLKIWEGTYDLLKHFDSEDVTFSGKRVLDLGCGAGLLGILALKKGASTVHFQDYNSTVIEQITIPNVFLNCEEECDEDTDGSPAPKRKATNTSTSEHKLTDCCKFFSGDWSSYLSMMHSKDAMLKYDIILTSETIYNTEHYISLHNVFHKLLAENGIVYLATKSHYFGVGGGLYVFERFVKEKDVFQIKSLKDLDQGLKRHIVTMRFKK